MSEWWTYRPEDFLLFSPRVYWRMFELHNEALWPLHLVTFAVGAAIVVIALLRPVGGAFWVALILTALWALVGGSFLWRRYAAINWAIVYVAPAFWLQALLLAVIGAAGGLAFDQRDVVSRLGLLFPVIGLVVYPLLAPLFGRSWTSAEAFGLAPDPTAVLTLGLLLVARGRLVLLLLPIPLLWLLLSGLTLHAMGDAQAWLPLAAVGVSLSLLVLRWLAR